MNRLKKQCIPAARLCLLFLTLFSVQLVFSWNKEPQDINYTQIKNSQRIIGGYYSNSPPAPEPLIYLEHIMENLI